MKESKRLRDTTKRCCIDYKKGTGLLYGVDFHLADSHLRCRKENLVYS